MQQLPIRNITPEELEKFKLKPHNLVKEGDLVASEQSILKIKSWYTVAHVVLQNASWVLDQEGEFEAVPVHPLFHADKQFTSAPAHFHIDGRFTVKGTQANSDLRKTGYTNAAIFEKQERGPFSQLPSIVELIYIRKRCEKLTTGLDVDEIIMNGVTKFMLWQKSMVGKSCAGKKCPHYGTTMIDEGDRLVCPMHNLVGSKETMLIIADD